MKNKKEEQFATVTVLTSTNSCKVSTVETLHSLQATFIPQKGGWWVDAYLTRKHSQNLS